MKKILLLNIFVFIGILLCAQNKKVDQKSGAIHVSNKSSSEPEQNQGDTFSYDQDVALFTVVEEMPVFPGGNEEVLKYFSRNIKYPQMAKDSGTSGIVYVSFVVLETGKISNVGILRGIGNGCDEEALRVIESMPDWIPGKQRGKPVRVQYNIPIRFKLK